MISNPFASKTYETLWLKYFSKGKKAHSFNFISGVNFIKQRYLPLYMNVGKNLTNGMTYNMHANTTDYKGKVVLIYDVPDYFPVDNFTIPSQIKIKKIRQYPGLASNLSDINSLDELLEICYNSKSRSRFRGRVRQVESKLNITQKVYFGSISKDDYLREMELFKIILLKRFDQQNTFNNVLPIWDFYSELIYPLILEKKIAFHVIYDDGNPITMSINFVYDDIVVIAIRTFDIEYYKYNIGNYEVYKLFDWCITNNFSTLDFSKGEVDYKKRWANQAYKYEHHVIYDKKSLVAMFIAHMITLYFKFKQFLRDKKVNSFYNKLKYLFTNQLHTRIMD